MLLYFLKKSIANESQFLSVDNRVYNCQNDDFETIKKRKTFFRNRKFDILIKFI